MVTAWRDEIYSVEACIRVARCEISAKCWATVTMCQTSIVETFDTLQRYAVICVDSKSKAPRATVFGISPIMSASGLPFETCLQFRSIKSCDLTLRSKLCDTKSMTVGSRLHLHDGKSPLLQELKPSQSFPGTQHQGRKSLVLYTRATAS